MCRSVRSLSERRVLLVEVQGFFQGEQGAFALPWLYLAPPLLECLEFLYYMWINSGVYKTFNAQYMTTIIIRTKNHFNKMKKEVGMLLQKRAGTRAVGIYKLYEENTH